MQIVRSVEDALETVGAIAESRRFSDLEDLSRFASSLVPSGGLNQWLGLVIEAKHEGRRKVFGLVLRSLHDSATLIGTSIRQCMSRQMTLRCEVEVELSLFRYASNPSFRAFIFSAENIKAPQPPQKAVTEESVKQQMITDQNEARLASVSQWILHQPEVPNYSDVYQAWSSYRMPSDGESSNAFSIIPYGNHDELCGILQSVLFANEHQRRGAAVLQRGGIFRDAPMAFVCFEGKEVMRLAGGMLHRVMPGASLDTFFPAQVNGEVLLWDELQKGKKSPAVAAAVPVQTTESNQQPTHLRDDTVKLSSRSIVLLRDLLTCWAEIEHSPNTTALMEMGASSGLSTLQAQELFNLDTVSSCHFQNIFDADELLADLAAGTTSDVVLVVQGTNNAANPCGVFLGEHNSKVIADGSVRTFYSRDLVRISSTLRGEVDVFWATVVAPNPVATQPPPARNEKHGIEVPKNKLEAQTPRAPAVPVPALVPMLPALVFDMLQRATSLARGQNAPRSAVPRLPVSIADAVERLKIDTPESFPIASADDAVLFAHDIEGNLIGTRRTFALVFTSTDPRIKPCSAVVSSSGTTLIQMNPERVDYFPVALQLKLPSGFWPGNLMWAAVQDELLQRLPAAAVTTVAPTLPAVPHADERIQRARNDAKELPFRTITGTTSQYRAGGQAACTVIAIAAAERILGQAELTPAVIDAAVREGAEYRGTEQLVADEQISDQKWERFDFGQHSNAASMFRDLRQPDAAGGAPCAYVVTKPPETVVLLWLPARFLQKGADDVNATGPVWVLVDSHPRPEHGLASAYALVFDSFSALRDTMLQRQPFISSGIEDAWMYDVCEHIGIRLKKTDETSNAAVKAKEKDISRPSSISVTSACSWQGQRFNSAEGLCQQLGSTVDSATKCAVLQAELARVREALPGCIESIADKRAADLVTQLAILGERLGGHERKVRGPSDGTGGSR